MTANAHGSGEPVPGRPAAAARAGLVLTRLILRLRPRRSLRAIEQDLAASDPSLTHLFSIFTLLAQGEERGPAAEIRARPLRALTRWLATALEFDPADPWRRSQASPRVD
jgi:hypothetical protein